MTDTPKIKDESIQIPPSELEVKLAELRARQRVQSASKRRKAQVSVGCTVVGCLSFSVAAGALYGDWWLTAAIIGVVLLTVGILLGRDG